MLAIMRVSFVQGFKKDTLQSTPGAPQYRPISWSTPTLALGINRPPCPPRTCRIYPDLMNRLLQELNLAVAVLAELFRLVLVVMFDSVLDRTLI